MKPEILFPNEVILETQYFKVSQDWEVPIPGFFIIATKRKIRSVCDFTKQEASQFINILCEVRLGMQEKLKIKDTYLFQNEDTEHGFHFWLFPRHDWMDLFGRKIQSVREIMDYAKKIETIEPIIAHSKKTMNKEDIIKNVKDNAQIMRQYLKDFSC